MQKVAIVEITGSLHNASMRDNERVIDQLDLHDSLRVAS